MVRVLAYRALLAAAVGVMLVVISLLLVDEGSESRAGYGSGACDGSASS